MAYLSKNLSVLAYANGFTLWHYTTADLAADVDTQGYFNAAADMLRAGDMILANTDTGGTPASGVLLVQSAAAGAVDVHDLSELPAAKPVRVPFFINQTDLLAGTSQYVVSPVAGRIAGVTTVVQTAVTTGGTITVELGGVAVDGLSVVVANSSAAGDIDSDTATSGHASTAVAAGAAIEIVPSAAFDTAGAINGFVEILPTADSD